MMNTADYVDEIVTPTVRDLRDNPRSRRHAYLACITTFHIKDYLKSAGETGIETKMRASGSKAFDVVRAICNGTKHLATNPSHPIPFEVGTDFDRPPAVLGEMILGVSLLGDTVGGREIGRGRGKNDIYASCKAALLEFQKNFPLHLQRCDLSDC